MRRGRDHLIFTVNGVRQRVKGAAALGSLLDFLRDGLGLRGAKRVCEQGDCGACGVLVGRCENGSAGSLAVRPITACVTRLYQLDCTQVVTVEGIGTASQLSPVQQALVDGHGSQCGLCTPGMVVSLTGLFEQGEAVAPSEDALREALSGNLCRCTGYAQILDAARGIDPAMFPLLADRYADPRMQAELAACELQSVDIDVPEEGARGAAQAGQRIRRIRLPRSLEEAVGLRAKHPGALVLAGATSRETLATPDALGAETLISLGAVRELAQVERRGGRLVCGALASWARFRRAVRDELPELAALIGRLGSPQIRELGSLGGHVVAGSPTADLLPFLSVSDTELELVGSSGTRTLSIVHFYDAKGRAGVRGDEILARISFALPAGGEQLALYKVARRRDVDTATLVAAIRLRVEGGRIRDPRIAYGGAPPRVVRLAATESFLAGSRWSEQTLREAGVVAGSEIEPISDVRASAAHRRRLAENLLVKAYHDIEARVA